MIEHDLDSWNRKWKGAVAPLHVYGPSKSEPNGIIYRFVNKIDFGDGAVYLYDRRGVPHRLWSGKPANVESYDPLYMHFPPRIYESNIGPVALMRRNAKTFKLGLSQETHFIMSIADQDKEFKWESIVFDKPVTPTRNRKAEHGVIDDHCWWKNKKVYNLATVIGLMNTEGEVFLSHKELIPFYQRKWGSSWTILPQ